MCLISLIKAGIKYQCSFTELASMKFGSDILPTDNIKIMNMRQICTNVISTI